MKAKEIEITFYKSSGPGGQRKNKKETAVKVRHIPTGITAIATEQKSQAQNKELASIDCNKSLKYLIRRRKSECLQKYHTILKKGFWTKKRNILRRKKQEQRWII